MSHWHGPAYRGAMADLRALKRTEATNRNAITPDRDRRSSRGQDDGERPGSQACLWPHKTAYENRGRAQSALRGMFRSRKGQGLHPYPCPAGHWHLGRVFRRTPAAWRSAA